MEDRISEMLSFCSRINFGAVVLSREEKNFRGDLNREIVSLCEYLPQSMQTKAILFLMEYLHASFYDGINFVNYFYAPAWSILFWLHRSCPDKRKLDLKYLRDAKTGHTMAMFLHAFDDHLADGQLSVSHMALLIRSQAWMIMNQAFERLSREVGKGEKIVHRFINDYYSSIDKSYQPESLDQYCEIFKKQMATWLIVPVLLAYKISNENKFVRSIEMAYTSFGIAWRLLDDIQDLEKDMEKGVHSSPYICLPNKLKKGWNRVKKEKAGGKNDSALEVLNYIQKDGVIDRIRQKICSELESAAVRVEKLNLAGFAVELRGLLKPLEKRYNFL